jgi:hypothetical protein
VMAQRAGRDLTVPVSWDVRAPSPARAAVPSGRPLAPYVDGLAVLLVAGLATAVALRRRRSAQATAAELDDDVLVGS